MVINETTNNAGRNKAANSFKRVTEFDNLGRTDFLSKLRLEEGSRVLEIGNVTDTPQDETLICANNTVPELLCSTSKTIDSSEISDVNFTHTNVDLPRLPYRDAAFDAVVSPFGAMYSLRPDRMVAEINRVCRPGGIIALGSWTPDSVIGQMFRLASRYSPYRGNWPFLWGRASWLRMCFGEAASDVEFARYVLRMRFPFPVSAAVDLWLTYCRPLANYFAGLPLDRQTDLRLDLDWLLSGHNLSTDDGTTVLEAEWLYATATRRFSPVLERPLGVNRQSGSFVSLDPKFVLRTT